MRAHAPVSHFARTLRRSCDHLDADECNPGDVGAIPVPASGASVVGREAPADIIVPIVTVSGAHAKIESVGECGARRPGNAAPTSASALARSRAP